MNYRTQAGWAKPIIDRLGSFDIGLADIVSCNVSGSGDGFVVRLTLAYKGHRVELTFRGVEHLRIPESYRVGLQLSEPSIEDVSDDGLEHIRTRLTDEVEDWLIEARSIEARVL
jgi:hypothetical protein